VSNDSVEKDREGPRTALTALAGWVVRNRRVVLIAWAVVFVAGSFAAARLSSRLSYNFATPGQPAYQTALRIEQHWGNGGQSAPAVVVVTVPAGRQVADDRSAIETAFTTLARDDPSIRVVDLANAGTLRFVTANGRSTWAYLFTPPATSLNATGPATTARQQLARLLPADTVTLTGVDQLQAGSTSHGPGVLVETMIGGAGALAILLFVFGSFLALLPLVVAAVAIVSTFLILLGLSYVTQVSFVVEFLVSLVGLGVGIDYSLLLVTRWREERARGLSNVAAVTAATDRAGRAVALSGLTVAIGLLALVVLPVPLLRSTGLGGMLIPLVSVSVVLTLMPALLATVGERMDRSHRDESRPSRPWQAWAQAVVHRPWLAAGAAVVVLGVAVFPAFGIQVGQTSAAAQARSGPAHETYASLLAGGVPAGVLTPIEVLTTAAAAPRVAAGLDRVAGVAGATLPTGRAGIRHGLADVLAIPERETVNSVSLAAVRAVEATYSGRPGVLGVSGLGASDQGSAAAIYGQAPVMLAIIALLTLILLTWAFRSLLLAAKAVVLNLVSLAATIGVLTWFWQSGHGSQAIFGIPATGAITFWVPISVFAFLFGLSMDYEVFILVRIREEYDRTGSTSQAVVGGLARTGRLVTSAALILFLAFASLASAPLTDIKVLATGLGIGILLDATVVRALLVPALVTLFGRANWWLPPALARRWAPPASASASASPPAAAPAAASAGPT